MKKNTENCIGETRFLNILIVDRKSDANHLKTYIQDLAHKAFVLENYREAVIEVKKREFDLIMVELNHNGGIDLIKEVRKSNRDQQILAMTSKSNREIERIAREQRVIYYMIKPFNSSELKSILNHLVKRKEQN